jgi:hypothetical protein
MPLAAAALLALVEAVVVVAAEEAQSAEASRHPCVEDRTAGALLVATTAAARARERGDLFLGPQRQLLGPMPQEDFKKKMKAIVRWSLHPLRQRLLLTATQRITICRLARPNRRPRIHQEATATTAAVVVVA